MAASFFLCNQNYCTWALRLQTLSRRIYRWRSWNVLLWHEHVCSCTYQNRSCKCNHGANANSLVIFTLVLLVNYFIVQRSQFWVDARAQANIRILRQSAIAASHRVTWVAHIYLKATAQQKCTCDVSCSVHAFCTAICLALLPGQRGPSATKSPMRGIFQNFRRSAAQTSRYTAAPCIHQQGLVFCATRNR